MRTFFITFESTSVVRQEVKIEAESPEEAKILGVGELVDWDWSYVSSHNDIISHINSTKIDLLYEDDEYELED